MVPIPNKRKMKQSLNVLLTIADAAPKRNCKIEAENIIFCSKLLKKCVFWHRLEELMLIIQYLLEQL